MAEFGEGWGSGPKAQAAIRRASEDQERQIAYQQDLARQSARLLQRLIVPAGVLAGGILGGFVGNWGALEILFSAACGGGAGWIYKHVEQQDEKPE